VDHLSVGIEGPVIMNPLEEGPGKNTNNAAQDGLTTIVFLGMVGDQLLEEIPQQDQGNHDFRGVPRTGDTRWGQQNSTE